MKRTRMIGVLCLLILIVAGSATYLFAGGTESIQTSSGGLKLNIVPGEHYLHKLQIFPLIKIKTPPQFAVWVEDRDGNYVKTLYVTSKIAEQRWSKAPGDSTPKAEIKRMEALPYWTHKRASAQEQIDLVSSATPKKDPQVVSGVKSLGLDQFVIYAEFNNSTDFNESYPQDAKPEDANYSGGKWGSGQPAVVYAVQIDLNAGEKQYMMQLIGHSSPDGADGLLYTNLSGLTTAMEIIQEIRVELE